MINLWYVLYICLPFAAFFVMYCIWWYQGRDEDSDKAVGVEWHPPDDLAPAEIAVLLKERCSDKAVVASVIDLAARGYLKIREVPGFLKRDYEFIRLGGPEKIDGKKNKAFVTSGEEVHPDIAMAMQEIEKMYDKKTLNELFPEARGDIGLWFTRLAGQANKEGLSSSERNLLDGLFDSGGPTQLLSSLHEKFYPVVDTIDSGIGFELAEKGYFKQSPAAARLRFALVSGAMAFLAWLTIKMHNWPAGLSLLLTYGVIVSMSQILPARTAAGSKALRATLGYKRFLELVEANSINTMPKTDPATFGRLYAYAMVLDVTNKWMDRMHNMSTDSPKWFELDRYDSAKGISAVDLVLRLDEFSRSAEKIFASEPKKD